MHLVHRFFELTPQSYFLFGPRGTGKSTWLNYYYPKAFFLNLLDDQIYRSYQAKPERLIDTVEANLDKHIFVIDEVQKIPELLNAVHLLIEKHKNLQFILTGSSARKLKRSGIDLLAGRALLETFHPFMAAELGKKFNLETALVNGLIPLIMQAPNKIKALNTYISLYLKEEVQQEGLTRNIGHFTRFLETISFSHASSINKNHIARECQVTAKIVDNYLSILQDLLLAFELPIFTKRAKRETVQNTKFYLFDPGVFNNLRPKGALDRTSEIEGLALEGLIAEHLRAWCDYSNEQTQLFFWRTRGGAEIDFILYGEKYFHAIEVKNSTIIHPQDLRHLKTFKADYPECTALLLYRGKEAQRIQDILCLPVNDFLLHLKPNNHLPLL